jgi:hypothetical protein
MAAALWEPLWGSAPIDTFVWSPLLVLGVGSSPGLKVRATRMQCEQLLEWAEACPERRWAVVADDHAVVLRMLADRHHQARPDVLHSQTPRVVA